VSGDRLDGPVFPSAESGAPSEPGSLASPRRASHGVHRASERYYVDRPAAHWLTAASPLGLLSVPSVTHPTDRPPSLSVRVHSLVPSVPSGVPSPEFPARPCPTRYSRIESRQAATPARISSLIATSPAASTIPPKGPRSLPTSLRSVLELSQLLDGFLRHRLCELVSSRSHVQGSSSVQGILSIHSGRRFITVAFPRAVQSRKLTGMPAATCAPVDFGALLREPMRSVKPAVKPASRPLPSSGSLLSQGPARPP
jgi:hypothetical protein